jgi:hypothetical protein
MANKKKQVLITNKYKPLITDTSLITFAMIDEIADKIKEGLSPKTASILCGINYDALTYQVTRNKSTKELHEYIENAFAQATAQFEEKLTKTLLDPTQFNSQHLKMIERFLEIVSPRFSTRLRVQYKYDLNIFLDNARLEVDEETFIRILERLKNLDSTGVVAEYDDKLNFGE